MHFVAVLRQHQRRDVIAFLQPSRDNPDDARVPVRTVGERQSVVFRTAFDLRDRLFVNVFADLAAQSVQFFQLFGDFGGFGFVARAQQLHAQRRVADSSARVQARTDDESQMKGGRLFLDVRHVGQDAQSLILPARHHVQPRFDKQAVQPAQSHHVAHRPQRDQIQKTHQIGFGSVFVKSPFAQQAVHRDDGHKNDADRRHLAARVVDGFVQPFRIDQSQHVRFRGVGFVVVDDDDVDALFRQEIQRFESRRAAVDRDDQTRSGVDEFPHRVQIGTVPLFAFRNAAGDVGAQSLQKLRHHGRRRRPVHVVIAEHADFFAVRDGVGDAAGGFFHIAQDIGIGQMPFKRRRHKKRHVFGRDPANGEQPRDHFGNAGGARDGFDGFGRDGLRRPKLRCQGFFHP